MIRRFKQFPRPHKVAISVLSVLVGLLSLAPSEPAVASRHLPPPELSAQLLGERQPLGLPLNLEDAAEVDTPILTRERAITVHSGDTLSAIFARSGLSSTLLHEINQLKGVSEELAKLYLG